jgi:ABC-type thiamin/hydroxymethylpyrimidine transport system permease subunit/DMSO/TMAO reductase YedYZ molybdopterin-dependent catalytic subunit
VVPKNSRYYFTTRDLIMMATLAALGGVSSTALNALSKVVHAAVGFSGAMQWAAGLHILWLVLAVTLTGRAGAGTITGLLKGAVELLTGNTHGVLVVLIDVIAGLLVDLGFLPFRRRDSALAYCLAGGLSATSNVFVFQFFAAAPEEVLPFIWGVAAVAFVSGVVFAGLLGLGLTAALRRAGVVKDRSPVAIGRWVVPASLASVAVLAVGAFLYLRAASLGPATVQIEGAVDVPFAYSPSPDTFEVVDRELEWNDQRRRYTGVRLLDILNHAGLQVERGAVLVSATDGYSFFITLDEVRENTDLLLAHKEGKDGLSYEIAGARNSKAQVRNVSEIRVVAQSLIEVWGAVEVPFPYDPDQWQTDMENGRLDIGYGERKYQGTSFRAVLDKWSPEDGATTVVLHERGGGRVELSLEQIRTDAEIRIWNVNTEEGIHFAVAKAGDAVLARDVVEIEVQ